MGVEACSSDRSILYFHGGGYVVLSWVPLGFVALFLLYHSLRSYRYHDLVSRLQSYSAGAILIALGLTAINYFILTFYDVLALRYADVKLSYPKTAFASFMSYVFSYNVGLSLFGSSALRYRFYTSWGVDGSRIARIVTFCVSTFWLGLAVMGGAAVGGILDNSQAVLLRQLKDFERLDAQLHATGRALLRYATTHNDADNAHEGYTTLSRMEAGAPHYNAWLGSKLLVKLVLR